jgi:hypothetical protein
VKEGLGDGDSAEYSCFEHLFEGSKAGGSAAELDKFALT